MPILPDETYADVPQLEWELERKVGACVACGRAVLFALVHPPIPLIVLNVFDLDTGEPCGTECRHCGADLDIPADFSDYTVTA